MTAGERIKAARDLIRLPSRQLDKLAGLDTGVSWAVENSATGNSQSATLDKIARALGLSLDYVVRGEGEPPTAESVQAAVDAARAALPEAS
jgi:transcriptional regulator with XRE-family HTH domain